MTVWFQTFWKHWVFTTEYKNTIWKLF